MRPSAGDSPKSWRPWTRVADVGDAPRPLSDREIAERLEQLPGWERSGDTITRSYGIRSSADVTHGL
ncbi:hypothetical protein [Streptomyces sp. enrichment culture]|uniref:hypothetical protein n=1 Tax=Streptomyces sp. enrichment culture TaxID=1795815 RepID=UPI003F56C5A2